jgi:hypothetical protein
VADWQPAAPSRGSLAPASHTPRDGGRPATTREGRLQLVLEVAEASISERSSSSRAVPRLW